MTAQDRDVSLPVLFVKGLWVLADPLIGLSLAVLTLAIVHRRRDIAPESADRDQTQLVS